MPELHGLPEEGKGYLPAGRLAGQPAAAMRPPDIAADQCQQSIPEVIGPADDREHIRNQVHRTDDQAGRSQEGSVAKLGFRGKIQKSGFGKSITYALQLSCFW
jgi:hypothetical protein